MERLTEMSASAVHPKIWLRSACRANGLVIDDGQLDILELYVRKLLEANKSINLISRKDEASVWEHHILHSLSILFVFSLPTAARVIDVGTGGGLPGIPLKIVRPDLHMSLVDATRKKIESVSTILQHIDIKEVTATWCRVEDIAKTPGHAGKYDFAVARGVASLGDLVRWVRPLIVQGGNSESVRADEVRRRPIMLVPGALIAMKGGEISDELRKAERLKQSTAVDVFGLDLHGPAPAYFEDKKIVLVRF